MYEIVKFTDEQGRNVEITPEDVKRHLCPAATDSEIGMFLALCKAQRLNPFIKDAYLVKYGNGPASIITSKEVFTKRANANKTYKGFEAGVVFVDKQGKIQHREGSAVYKAAGETLVGGWCRVFVDGRQPFYDEVSLMEYSTGKSGWAKMPATMIRKVALVHCLREAFPDDFQGLYSQEEMGNAGDAVIEQNDNRAYPNEYDEGVKASYAYPVEFTEMMNEQQEAMLQEQAATLAEMRGVAFDAVMRGLYAAKSVQATGAREGVELTAEQADTMLQLLGLWIEQAREKAQPDAVQVAMEQAKAASIENMADEDIAF